jgi:NTE family protein
MSDIINYKNINNLKNYVMSKFDILINKKINKVNNKEILVLSGGGIKGYCHIGALMALYRFSYLDNLKIIIGTSIGAIIGSLIAIGYNIDELYKLIFLHDINNILNINIGNIFNTYGIDDGNKIILYLEELFNKKNINSNITFYELFKKKKIKLIITGTCVNDKNIVYFSYDNYPNMAIISAVRISFSIPIIFTPVIINNKMYIDGGCIDNLHINIFNNENSSKIIGINLINKFNDSPINNLFDYISRIYLCMFDTVYVKYLEKFNNCVVNINVDNLCGFNYNINSKKKMDLYNLGYNFTINLLQNNDI